MELKISSFSEKTFRYLKLLLALGFNVFIAFNNPWYATLCTIIASILFLYIWDHFKFMFNKTSAKELLDDFNYNHEHSAAIYIGIFTIIGTIIILIFNLIFNFGITESYILPPWYVLFLAVPGFMMVPGLWFIYLIRLWAEKTN